MPLGSGRCAFLDAGEFFIDPGVVFVGPGVVLLDPDLTLPTVSPKKVSSPRRTT